MAEETRTEQQERADLKNASDKVLQIFSTAKQPDYEKLDEALASFNNAFKQSVENKGGIPISEVEGASNQLTGTLLQNRLMFFEQAKKAHEKGASGKKEAETLLNLAQTAKTSAFHIETNSEEVMDLNNPFENATSPTKLFSVEGTTLQRK